VLNHTSSEHPWFIEARDNPGSDRRNWYIWSQDKPNYLGPWGEEVWHPSPSGYYYGIFWSGMPDLNLKNPQVTAEIENVARFWLEDAGVDGFRLDGARHLIEEGSIQENTPETHAWWKNFRTVYKASKPQALAVGEVWTQDSDVAPYVQGDELDLAFDFDLAEAIISGVKISDAGKIQGALQKSYGLFGSSRSATFLTNHDINRVMNQLHTQADKARLAASVLLTIPGVPFIYYGEEIGMTGVKPDEMIRTPMQWSAGKEAGFTAGTPWEPVNSDFQKVNITTQSKDPTSLLSHYCELIRIRLAHPALQAGGYLPVDSGNDEVLAFLRLDPGSKEHVLVVLNLSENAVSAYDLALKEGPLTGSYRALHLFGGEAELPQLTAIDTGGFISYQPLPAIPAGNTLIIQLQPIS
jgi:glycosidase